MARGRPLKDYPASSSPTMLDIAWAAGIYEGEGCCTFVNTTPSVNMSQKERWILDKLVDLFGGVVYENPHKGVMRYIWRLSGPRMYGFIYTIFTWLSPHKRIQIRQTLAGNSLKLS